jgi:hypothetical protein
VVVAVGRPPARALALALVPQRRVGVAVVMMRGCGRGERGFSARPFAAAAAAAAARPCLPACRTLPLRFPGCALSLPRVSLCAGNGPTGMTSAGETRRPDFTARLAGVIRFGFSGVEERAVGTEWWAGASGSLRCAAPTAGRRR